MSINDMKREFTRIACDLIFCTFTEEQKQQLLDRLETLRREIGGEFDGFHDEVIDDLTNGISLF